MNENFLSDKFYDPRLLALEVLDCINNYGVTTDIAIEKICCNIKKISRADQSLANAIIYGVLRNRGALDWIISKVSTTGLEKIESSVLNILRIGLFQIKYLDRIPASAAVNTSVELSKKTGKKPFIHKFINAVLRKAASCFDKIEPPDISVSRSFYFSAVHSIPEWLAKRWLERFGETDTVALCKFVNSIPPLSVRTNSLKTCRAELFEKLKVYASEARLHRFSDDGINIFGFNGKIVETDEFQSGFFQIQDEAAQMIAILLDARPYEKILDACCGLGGKTGHIGQMMKNSGEIIASDNDIGKLKSMGSEMQRLGIENVKPFQHDFSKPVTGFFDSYFDRILVDAPCSGLGVIRRNPDAKWSDSKRNLSRYGSRQTEFLENVAGALKPGGRLVYAVCTFEPEENQAVARNFLKLRDDFFLDEDIPAMLKKHPFINPESGMIQILPHIAGMDGFFAACFKRKTV